jgi:hypothetical protein
MLALLGEQSGVVAKAFRNCAPSRAMRSIFGVCEKGCPAQPRSSQRRSSTNTKMMFGLAEVVAAKAVATAASQQKAASRYRVMV